MYRITKAGKHGPDGGGSIGIPSTWFVDGVAYVDDPDVAQRYEARGYAVKFVQQAPEEYRVTAERMLKTWADKGIVVNRVRPA